MLEQDIYDKRNFRKTVEGILYRMRTGCPWRDLPQYFGKWNSVYQQFNRWSASDKLMSAFKLLVDEPDLEWSFIDGSLVKAHQHSACAAGGGDQGIGKSRGGLTTKIHMSVDSCGFPLHFKITGGEVHDSKTASELINEMPVTEYVVGDKGYDSEAIREQIEKKGSTVVIPRKSHSKKGNEEMDWYLYKMSAPCGKYVCENKALSSDRHSLRQIKAKLFKHGSLGLWICVVANVINCQQTLVQYFV